MDASFAAVRLVHGVAALSGEEDDGRGAGVEHPHPVPGAIVFEQHDCPLQVCALYLLGPGVPGVDEPAPYPVRVRRWGTRQIRPHTI